MTSYVNTYDLQASLYTVSDCVGDASHSVDRIIFDERKIVFHSLSWTGRSYFENVIIAIAQLGECFFL
jgi:hypothetical protein